MSDPLRHGPPLPPPGKRLPVDLLLTELHERIDEILVSRERQNALLDAVITVGSGLELPTILDRILTAARTLVDARYGALGAIDDGGGLIDFRTTGLSAEEAAALGEAPTNHGLLGFLAERPRPLRLADLTAHPAATGFPEGHPQMRTFLGVPIMIGDKAWGSLYVADKNGGGEFTEDDETVVIALSAAAGVAVDNARLYTELAASQRERERLLLFQDRDRISRDLHDVVIQRLFTTGLQLQNAIGRIEAPDAVDRVNLAVDEIDGAIADLRAAIFSLHTDAEVQLSATIRTLAGLIGDQLGFAPQLRFSGPVDSAVPVSLRIDVLAMLREALSNVARHSRAENAVVTVSADEELLTVVVADDGRGIPPGAPRRGLANLAARAAALGGTFAIADREPSGTELRWRLPL